jgi:hypothetical protein
MSEQRGRLNEPLGSAGVRRDDDAVLDVDVSTDVVDGRRLGVELLI